MANNYTQFSEVLPNLTDEEARWLKKQLEVGCEGFGALYQFDTDDERDGWGRHLWFYAEEVGDPEQVVCLVQKFLRRFRPDQYWSLTFACTCSKPRVGAFDGGAVFVTANDIKWQDVHGFIEAEAKRFPASPEESPPSEPRPSHLERDGRCVLYSLGADELFSKAIYDSRKAAIEDAAQVDDVILVPFYFGKNEAHGSSPGELEGHYYALSIDGPTFRAQRELLLQLLESSQRPTLLDLRSEQGELLEGLIQLAEAISDQAADRYGIDCLL